MSTDFIIYFDDNNQLKEINIENPNSYEDLIKILFEKEYTIFYKSDGKEKNIQSNEEFQKSNKKLFIRPKKLLEKTETILPNNDIQKPTPEDTFEDNNKVIQLEKEIEKKNEIIKNNKKYISKSFNIFKDILNKMKEIDKLINPTNNNEIKGFNNILSSEDSIQKSIDDLSNVILKDLENFKQYTIINSNKNLINEDKINKNEGNKPKKVIKNKTEIKRKDKFHSTKISEVPMNENPPYSCIPRIVGGQDISYDKLGKK